MRLDICETFLNLLTATDGEEKREHGEYDSARSYLFWFCAPGVKNQNFFGSANRKIVVLSLFKIATNKLCSLFFGAEAATLERLPCLRALGKRRLYSYLLATVDNARYEGALLTSEWQVELALVDITHLIILAERACTSFVLE